MRTEDGQVVVVFRDDVELHWSERLSAAMGTVQGKFVRRLPEQRSKWRRCEDSCLLRHEERVSRTGKNIRNFVPPPTIPPPQLNEVSSGQAECAHKGAPLFVSLNSLQELTILSAVIDLSQTRLFLINRPGGSGKTYLNNTILTCSLEKKTIN